EPRDEVVRQRHALERRTEHELVRMQDERRLRLDLDELGEVLLLQLHVDEGVARVAEDTKESVDADVDARRLDEVRVEWVDPDAAFPHEPPDGSIRQDHRPILVPPQLRKGRPLTNT